MRNSVVDDPYKQIPAVYRSVNSIAGAFVDGKRQITRGAGEERVLIEPPGAAATKDMFDVLDNPNDLMEVHDFEFVVAAIALLYPLAHIFAQPGDVTGQPVRLLPLPPMSVRPVRAFSDPWTVLAWEYRHQGGMLYLRYEDIVPVRFAPDPTDPVGGVSPAQPAESAMDQKVAADDFNKHALQNSGMSGILAFDDTDPIDDDVANEIRRELDSYMAIENAQKLAVMTGKFQWIPTSGSAKDMQYAQQLKHNLEEMVRSWGVPPLFQGVFEQTALARASVQVQEGLLYHPVFQLTKGYDAAMTRIVRRFDRALTYKTSYAHVKALKDDEDANWKRAEIAQGMGMTRRKLNERFDLDWPDLDDDPHADTSFMKQGLVPTEIAAAGGGLALLGGIPGTLPSEGLPPQGGGESTAEVTTTQATVLNGAQVQAATEIVQKVATGELPRDAGLGLLETLFNLDPSQAAKMMGSAGTGTATQPNKNPNDDDSAAPTPADDGASSRSGSPTPATPNPSLSRTASLSREEVRERRWRAFITKVEPYERKIASKLKVFLNETRSQVLASITQEDEANPPTGDVARMLEGLRIPSDAAERAQELNAIMGWEKPKPGKKDYRLWALSDEHVEQNRAFAEHIVTRGADDSSDIFDANVFAELIRAIIELAFRAGALGADKELLDIGVVDDSIIEADKDRLPSIVDIYATQREGHMVLIAESIRAELKSTLVEGYRLGESVHKLKERVRKVFNVSNARALRIARTESGMSVNTGRHESIKRNYPNGKKGWLGSRDGKERTTHKPAPEGMDGLRLPIVDADGNETLYPIGLRYPLDPEFGPIGEKVNCRCGEEVVSEALEAFEAETALAASLDVDSDYIMLRTSAENLARRAVHLGTAVPLDTIARHVPAAVAEIIRKRTPNIDYLEALRQHHESGELRQNAAIAGAMARLGGTVFVTEWARAFGHDVRAQAL